MRNKQARTNTFTRNSHLHLLNTRDLGASLPLPLKLVPPTTSTPVQVIQYTLLCWTYGLFGRNQDKPGVIVFLLHHPSGDRDTHHILLVGARPRGQDTDSWYAR